MDKFNPYEALKQLNTIKESERVFNRKLESSIRSNMAVWETAFKIGASEARGKDTYRAHIPETPEDWVCPVCQEECKGKKIGIMHGKGNIRMHEKCFINVVTHDPSGYTYAFYSSFGLQLSKHKMDKIYFMLGCIYNRIVDTMEMAKSDAVIHENLRMTKEEVVEKDEAIEEVKLSTSNPAIIEESWRANQKYERKQIPEYMIRKQITKNLKYENPLDLEEVITIVKYKLKENPRQRIVDCAKEVNAMGNEEYFNTLAIAKGEKFVVKDEPIKEAGNMIKPSSIEELANLSMQEKVNRMTSNDRKLQELLAKYNSVK